MTWAPHSEELLSADALRAAYRLGERFVFNDAAEVVDVRTYEEHDFDKLYELPLFGQASRSEVCEFLTWFRPDWTDKNTGYAWTCSDATTMEFGPGDYHSFGSEGAVYVQTNALLHLRKHAYALHHLVEVGGGDQ